MVRHYSLVVGLAFLGLVEHLGGAANNPFFSILYLGENGSQTN